MGESENQYLENSPPLMLLPPLTTPLLELVPNIRLLIDDESFDFHKYPDRFVDDDDVDDDESTTFADDSIL